MIFDGSQNIEKAVVGILNSNNLIIATGFYISSDGYLLTCFHAVSKLSNIQVIDDSKKIFNANFHPELSAPHLDIAVLKIDIDNSAPYFLLTFDWKLNDEIWSTGYQFHGDYIKKPIPITGKIQGTTAITFKMDEIYELPRVLKLDSNVEPGISGAPLLLTKSSKVSGIINAKFNPGGSFAVPFDAIAAYTDLFVFLKDIITGNEKEMQRHLYTIFSDYNDYALQRLTDKQLYLPDQFCERKYLDEKINDFVLSQDKLLVVTGKSGVGKTSALANNAKRLNGNHTVLFFSAYMSSLSPKGLLDDILNDFNFFLDNTTPVNDNFDAAKASFNNPEMNFIIILDAINEIKIQDENIFQRWLDHTMDWIDKHPVKLIFSSRPDFWEQYKGSFPKRLFYDAIGNDNFEVKLNDFDSAEFDNALETYRLPLKLKDKNDLRHPLLLRLYWDINANARNDISYYKLFNNFTISKCRKIAKQNNISEGIVFNHLLQFTKLISDNKYWLEESKYYNLFGALYFLPDAFLTENIVTKSKAGIRIVFDQLAEYLTSELYTVDVESLSWNQVFLEWNYQRKKALPWIFAKMEKDSDIKSKIVELAKDTSIIINFDVLQLFNTIVTYVEKPEVYFEIIVEFYERAHENRRDKDYSRFITDLLGSIQLPISQYMDLIKIGIRNEEYYDWEFKHWVDLSFERFEMQNLNRFISTNCTSLLRSRVDESFYETMPVVAAWLKDNNALASRYEGSNIAHVCDLASGFLFHFRNRDFPFIMQLIANQVDTLAHENPSLRLLKEICERNPLETISVLLNWHKDGVFKKIITQLAQTLLRIREDNEDYRFFEKMLYEMSIESEDMNEQYYLYAALVQVPLYRKEMILNIFNLYENYKLYGFYYISDHLSEYFDLLFPKIKKFIGNEVDNYQKGECLDKIMSSRLTENQYQEVIEYIGSIFSSHESFSKNFYRGAEILLRMLPFPSSLYDQTLDLVKKGTDELLPDDQTPLLYYITGFDLTRQKKQTLIDLMLWLIKQPNFKSNLEFFSSLLITNALSSIGLEKTFDILRMIITDNYSDELIDKIMHGFYSSNTNQANELFTLLLTDSCIASYKKLEVITNEISKGMEYHRAIEKHVFQF